MAVPLRDGDYSYRFWVTMADGTAGWQVDEPYGTDMIIALASPAPLFATPRPQFEPASDYLPALQGAIEAAERQHAPLAAAALLVLTTEHE